MAVYALRAGDLSIGRHASGAQGGNRDGTAAGVE